MATHKRIIEDIILNDRNEIKKDNYPEISENSEAQTNKANLLIKLVQNEELFHDEQGVAYITFKNIDHFETWPLDSPKCKDWLSYNFWQTFRKSLHHAALMDALCVLKGKALYEGECKSVYTRVAYANKKIYLNLADSKWHVIEIDEYGWKILENSSIKFKGSQNMRPLPMPVAGQGNFGLLWKHINIPAAATILVTAWLLDSLIPNTPFPVLLLIGLQGSGKSKTQERLRELIDPSTPNLRNPPKNCDDIPTAASNNWVVSYNNVSKLSNENQDDLCCLSTGGGFARRRLYTTDEELVIDIKRPIILNGITDVITRQDLLDRTVSIFLPNINRDNRKPESELDKAFYYDYPKIFTGLLDLLVKVLRRLPHIQLEKIPRMANYAILGAALEKEFNLPDGTFDDFYMSNYVDNMRSSIDNSPVANAVVNLIQDHGNFSGTYARLLLKLQRYRSKLPGWPETPKSLSNTLKRLAPAINMVGIAISFDERPRNDGYHIHISKKLDD